MTEIDTIIAHLYRSAGQQASGYRLKALTQVARIIDFDGALWGTGHLDSNQFHSVDVLGVDNLYPKALAETRDINPIFNAFKASPGQAVSMDSIYPDEAFFSSELYRTMFSKFGVERIMGVVLPDETTGIFTLISLYRFDRERPFLQCDKSALERLAFHLMNGASHAYFLHLQSQQSLNKQHALAICDQHGVFFEAQPPFIKLLNQYFPNTHHKRLPFAPIHSDNIQEGTEADGKLCYRQVPLGDLYCISLWESQPIDLLSVREQEVVNAVVHGLSFKEAAKTMGVAPSTVSNHLYKIYRKLNISSRSELAALVRPIESPD